MIFPICNKCPDRAPNINGHSFILCWRCTGLILGAIIGSIIKHFIEPLSIFIYVLYLPLAIDGILQYFFRIMSNNHRRFITGFIAGLTTLN
jgi:uncharacterized membrane protein